MICCGMELSKKREEGRSREMEKECATRLVGEVKRKKKNPFYPFPSLFQILL